MFHHNICVLLHKNVQQVLAAAAAPDIDDEGKMLYHLLQGTTGHLVTGGVHNVFNKKMKEFQKVHHHCASEKTHASGCVKSEHNQNSNQNQFFAIVLCQFKTLS